MKNLGILVILLLFIFVGCKSSDNDDDEDNGDDDEDNGDDDDTTDDDTDDDSADDDTTDDDLDDDDIADDDYTFDYGDAIENGDFESGEIEPWFGDWTGNILCDSTNCQPHDGNYSAWLGNCSNCTETLEQTISIPEEAGVDQTHYWLRLFKQGDPTGSLRVDLLEEDEDILIVTLEEVSLEDFPENGEWWHYHGDITHSMTFDGNFRFRFQLEVAGDVTSSASVQIDTVCFLWYAY